MSRRMLSLAGVDFIGVLSGCVYERGVGWRVEPGGVSDAVFDTMFSLIPDHRSAAERAEDDAGAFFDGG